jgi:mycofactocin biosynthesis protein MftB
VSTKAGGCGGPPLRAGAAGDSGASSPLASTAPDASAAAAFDLDQPWQLDDRVAVRPEPFGALLYHFGTRRLSFLKNTTVLTVVRSLDEHPSARSACAAAGVTRAAMPVYERALATLAESQMIKERGAAGSERGAAGSERGAAGSERGVFARSERGAAGSERGVFAGSERGAARPEPSALAAGEEAS